MTNKKNRGQFFTVNHTVQNIMVDLMENHNGKILEPSAGAGDLMLATINKYPNIAITGYELDNNINKRSNNLDIIYGDFFETIKNGEKFNSIIGNPPYVAWKNIEKSVQNNAAEIKQKYSDKVNLYYLFMDKCIDLLEDNGEIIFIVPKEWMYTTSARPLREKINSTGIITHIIDGGEEKVFPDADVPAIVIYRYQKTPRKKLEDHYTINYRRGFLKDITEWSRQELYINDKDYWAIMDENMYHNMRSWRGSTISDYFRVKVGYVTGADGIYNITNHISKELFIKEGTVKDFLTTKGIEQYIDVHDYQNFDDIPPCTKEYLLGNREALISRKIINFNDGNWWKYGAVRNKNDMISGADRIFTYGRTRLKKPFFLHDDVQYYGGGILCLFIKDGITIPKEKLLTYLNSDDFRKYCISYGITTSNKVSFQPSTLENLPFPSEDYFN